MDMNSIMYPTNKRRISHLKHPVLVIVHEHMCHSVATLQCLLQSHFQPPIYKTHYSAHAYCSNSSIV